jgi:hypothetical protein
VKQIGIATIVASALAFVPAVASAIELGSTGWRVQNDECNIVAIQFMSDGTAIIYDGVTEDGESGLWALDGNKLTLDYDNWYGGLEGIVASDTRIEASETWRDENTQTVQTDPCVREIE